MKPPRLNIGVDAGATRIRVANALGDGAPTESSFEVSGSLSRQTVASAVQAIAAAIRSSVGMLDLEGASIAVGAAGAGSVDVTRVEGRLHAALGAPQGLQIQVTDDLIIAYAGALGISAGTLVIAGSGSSLLSMDTGGRIRRWGGWGPLLGDPGSGHALGRGAVNGLATALDERAALSDFHRAVWAAVVPVASPPGAGGEAPSRIGLLRSLYRSGPALQSIAPCCLDFADRGDPGAMDIVRSEADRLGRMAARAAAEAACERRVCITGGLTRHALYARLLKEAIRDILPEAHLVEPAASPVLGALQRAARP